ncbi:uncharacterized protein PHALS_14457 [Plasmopara halstedii]|uniref:Uncharacterized protein n=1 Tax=Plasmopara halstedii TaxID=4781 RepID=A0A0P1ASJ2_PLAHL|nr:uncharacterized protein PHALS_14457 [Plasmopara halstedii]CEG44199.1 hypothetical protein PHALS_14457 [Plasmopara halstedii]|eukprot:XP_024580568.1 hypothetical protein PHALS_14457 [Plasmopara halstedii]
MFSHPGLSEHCSVFGTLGANGHNSISTLGVTLYTGMNGYRSVVYSVWCDTLHWDEWL